MQRLKKKVENLKTQNNKQKELNVTYKKEKQENTSSQVIPLSRIAKSKPQTATDALKEDEKEVNEETLKDKLEEGEVEQVVLDQEHEELKQLSVEAVDNETKSQHTQFTNLSRKSQLKG